MLMPQSPDAVDALFCPNEISQPRAAPRVAPPQPKPRSGEDYTSFTNRSSVMI